MKNKYEKAVLPSKKEALDMARERDAWADHARSQDKPGSAYEFELTALLLRFYVNRIMPDGS